MWARVGGGQFDLSEVHVSPAVVSLDKLKWFSNQHLRLTCQNPAALQELAAHIRPDIERLQQQHPERLSSPPRTLSDAYLQQVIVTLKVPAVVCDGWRV